MNPLHHFTEAAHALNYAFMAAALAFILMDVISGLSKGAATGTLSSSKMREGMWHKIGSIMAIIVVAMVDIVLYGFMDLTSAPVFEVFCGFIVMTEVVSIFENIKTINPELGKAKVFRLFSNGKGEDMDILSVVESIKGLNHNLGEEGGMSDDVSSGE